MVTIVNLVIGVVATVLFWKTGSIWGASIAVISTILCFWTAGIMHNHATQRAHERHQRFRQLRLNQGASQAEIDELDAKPINPSPEDIAMVPNSIARINLFASVATFLLCLWALIRWW